VLALCGVACVLPRRWSHRLGRRLGALAYLLSKRSRNVAHENLRRFLGVDAAEAARIAKASMRQAGASIFDLARAPRLTRLLVRRDIEVPEATWQAINAIRRQGKGAVFAGSHFGNWELGSLSGPFSALPQQTVIVRPIPNPWVDRLLKYLRGCTGQQVVHREGAAMECMQRVRDGEICLITFDLAVPPDAGAEAVDFFGVPSFTTVGVGYVAAMTGAPVYLAYFEPIGGCRYRFVLKGPIEAPERPQLRQCAVEITKAVSLALEEAIRECPYAWAWWMKRWKIRPDGSDPADWPDYSLEVRWFWPQGTQPRRDRDRLASGS